LHFLGKTEHFNVVDSHIYVNNNKIVVNFPKKPLFYTGFLKMMHGKD